MEGFDPTLGRGLKPDFDEAPARFHRRIGGVDYLHLRGRQNGDLFFTRHGWPFAASLLPERWFTGEQFRKPGQALAGATGAVYRVPVAHPVRSRFALVVKFSRFGQDVGITVADELISNRQFMAQVDQAEFLPPFEEFANIERLRDQCRGIFATKAPLAIYSPPTRYLAWQLGRKNHLQWTYRRQLSASQNDDTEPKVEYDWERIYILLYRWMDGIDLEQAHAAGIVSEKQMIEWTRHSAEQLLDLGWMVLDHKPRHLIVRPRRGRGILRRHEQPVRGLVDYELLVRTAAATRA
ncbi:MAG: hypothetical protein EHM17_13830 [Verrucomicrobiaceae bacterium]|nr:MAG: hypothetical protein EHM17_13830 [Verrucomicrobiaceae bacterium]